MQSSLLDRIFPAPSPLLPRHDRRNSRSPSSTTASAKSLRSPRVSSSTILRPAPVSSSLGHHSDPLLPINRAAKALQRTIQSFLDAQSERLLAGLTSNNGQEDGSSTGSLTPTPTMSSTTSPRKPTTIPIRQPSERKISLRGARRGLSRTMHEFAALKQEEERILGKQVHEREEALNRVETFIAKREGIQAAIASISSESPTQSAGHLRAEANELDIQIRDIENRLFEMKARHRHLVEEAQQLESSVQAKLSSYNASLDLLDKEIKRFLERPPIIQPGSGIERKGVDGSSHTESFYALNPKRRTLEMAKDHWREEQDDLQRRKEAIELEKTALQNGGQIWREVVTHIQTFEKDLKAQMQSLSIGSRSQQERNEGMATLISNMDQVMEFMERHLHEAEEKDWKLLICCIGAELEAFREGREILIAASGLNNTLLQVPEDQNASLGDPEDTVASTDPAPSSLESIFAPQSRINADEAAVDTGYGHGTGSAILLRPKAEPVADGEELNDLLPQLAITRTGTGTGLSSDSRSESEDDDPGPDFLISHT
jgi:hypothetical protein